MFVLNVLIGIIIISMITVLVVVQDHAVGHARNWEHVGRFAEGHA